MPPRKPPGPREAALWATRLEEETQMPHDSNPRTGCAGHPLPDIPLEDLRRSAAAAVSGAKDSTIAAFQVTDDDAGDSRTATRADLLELVAGAASRQGLAEMLAIFQDAGDCWAANEPAIDLGCTVRGYAEEQADIINATGA